LTGGTINVMNNSALGTGALDYTGGGGTVQAGANVTLANNVALDSSNNDVFDSNAHKLTLSGVIGDSYAPSALSATDSAGGGTLVLSGANTYSGGTYVNNAGNGVTLNVANNSALGTG
jgi:hypothetical protein